MHLIDRVRKALDDPLHHIDPHDFEDFARYALGNNHVVAEPISGGSDGGRDAEIYLPDGSGPFPLAITSSRWENGTKRNLGKAIESLLKTGHSSRAICQATLEVLNESRRKKLKSYAKDRGFELRQIYDRTFFINEFIRHPDWREKILRITAAPFSFSSTSGYRDQRASGIPLLGRDEELLSLSRETKDTIVIGAPGIGKSRLLESLPNPLFLQGTPDNNQLSNDIYSITPGILIIDDASTRLDLVSRLLVLRKQENLSFRLILACWPEAVETLTTLVTDATQIEIAPLPRSEIGKVLEHLKITAPKAQEYILHQARGRIGWAVHLALLLKDDDHWEEAVNGDGLAARVRHYLKRAQLPEDALQILAILAILQRTSEEDFKTLSLALNLDRLSLKRTLRKLTTGGLIDVTYNSAGEEVYTVVPELLAFSLISSEFFDSSSCPPLSVEELVVTFPHRREDITYSVVVAVARGTTHAKRVASYLFEELIQDTASLIKHLKIVDAYCQIGFYETKFVLSILNRIYRDSITTEIDVEKRTWFVKEVTPLLNRLVCTDEPQESIQFLAHIALDLEEANADASFLLTEVLKTIWGFDSSQDLNLDSVISFWTDFSEAVKNAHSRPGTQHRLLLRAAAELTKPEHDCAFLSPTARRTIHFVRASLAPQQYELLISNVMSTFHEEYQFHLDHLPLWFTILKNIKKIALKERNSTDKLKTSNPLNLTGVKLREIAEWFCNAVEDFPGIPTLITNLCHPFKLNLSVNDDTIFAAALRRLPFKDYTESKRRNQKELSALLSTLSDLSDLSDSQPILDLLDKLKKYEELIPYPHEDPTSRVIETLATSGGDPLEWALIISETNLNVNVSPLLRAAFHKKTKIPQLKIESLLSQPNTRYAVVYEALMASPRNDEVFQYVYNTLDERDVKAVEHVASSSRDTCVLVPLLTHQNRPLAATTALGVLLELDISEESFHEATLKALQESLRTLEFPFDTPVDHDHLILEALISFSPASYERVLGDALRNVIAGTVEAFTVINSFESSVHRLSGEARLRLWHALEEKEPNYVVQRVFAFLAGGDVDWISSVLANQTVSADFVMSAFNDADNALSVEDLSRLLVPLGVSPRKIAESAQWGFYTGQRSKHVQSIIDKMSALSRSNENVLQEVGQAGLAFYPPLLEKILKEERRKDILGEL